MADNLIVIRPDERDAALEVLGSKVTTLVSGDGFDLRVTVQSGDKGVGPPPHSHGWDESFFVIRGIVEFTCRDEMKICPAGTIVYVPANTVHSFCYGEGGGEFIEITGEASNSIAMFNDLASMIDSRAPDFSKVAQIFGEHGVTLQH